MQGYPTIMDAIVGAKLVGKDKLVLTLDEGPLDERFIPFAYDLFPDKIDLYSLTIGDVFREYALTKLEILPNKDNTVTVFEKEAKDSVMQFNPHVAEALGLQHVTWNELISMVTV